MATAQTTRLAELQARMSDAGLDLFVIQDPDSIAVFAGFWNYLGMSSLEEPQLKTGDTTRIEPGMAFAVDGGITIEGDFGTRVGDSVVVTEDGFEYLTDFPRELTVL